MVHFNLLGFNKKNQNYELGGRIDHAHHDNMIHRSLRETVEFDKAIKKGDDLTNDSDTLIVVTSDHAHVMYFAGKLKALFYGGNFNFLSGNELGWEQVYKFPGNNLPQLD